MNIPDVSELSLRKRALTTIRARAETLLDRMPTKEEAIQWCKTDGKRILRHHAVDTTTICAVANPVFALMDAAIGTYQDKPWHQISQHARLIGTASGYAGTVLLYEGARKLLRKYHAIDDSHEHAKWYDTAYGFGFNAALCAVLYRVSGERDLYKLATSSVCGGVAGMAVAYLTGRRMTPLRNLWLEEPCSLLPDHVQQLPRAYKKLLGAAGAAAAVAATLAVYAIMPDR